MDWKGIVIHHTAGHDGPGADYNDVKDYHVGQLRYLDIGYHWLCEKLDSHYSVITGRPMFMHGAHTLGKNTTHIGFCFAGNFDIDTPTPEMLWTGGRVIKWLMEIYKLQDGDVVAHRDLNATDCPGKNFNITKLMEYTK